MALVILIDILVVAGLVGITMTQGLERALPFFVFMVILVPLVSIIPVPLFNLSTQRIALLTLLGLYVAFGQASGEKPVLTSTPLKILILIYILWCVISTVNSVVPLVSFKKMLSTVVEYFLMYYIILRIITKVETVHRMMEAMVLAVFVACIFGIYEAYHPGWKVADYFPEVVGHFNTARGDAGRGDRAVSTFGNYSLFGSAIAFAIVEAFYLLRLAKTKARKVYLWVALILMFWVIYKTVTRGPWIALILGMALLLIYSHAQTRKTILVICLLAALTMIIRPGVYDTIKAIYLGTVNTDDPNNQLGSSYEYRYALWGVAERELAKSPGRQIWGYGMESWFELNITAPFEGNPEYPFLSCDSAYVQVMAETGYVGLFLTVLLLLNAAWLTLRDVLQIPKPGNYLPWILFINLLQYYFMMTNLGMWGWGQTAYMLWMWVAMSMSYSSLIRAQADGSKGQPAAVIEAEAESSEALHPLVAPRSRLVCSA